MSHYFLVTKKKCGISLSLSPSLPSSIFVTRSKTIDQSHNRYGLGRIKLRLESLEPFLEVLLSIARLNSENEEMWWNLSSRSCPSVRACITKRVNMLEKLLSTTQKAQDEIVIILKYVALEYQVRMGNTMQELQSVAQLKRLETGKLECVAFADSLQRCNTLLNDTIQTADFNLGLLKDALSGDCDPDAVISAVEGAQQQNHLQDDGEDEFALRRQKSRKAMVKSYALESHGIEGVHIPAVSLKRFYDHWKRYCYFSTGSRNIEATRSDVSPLHTDLYRGASFQEYLLLYPYKSEAELYLLMTTSPTRSASLQDARLLDTMSRNLVEYWRTPQVRVCVCTFHPAAAERTQLYSFFLTHTIHTGSRTFPCTISSNSRQSTFTTILLFNARPNEVRLGNTRSCDES